MRPSLTPLSQIRAVGLSAYRDEPVYAGTGAPDGLPYEASAAYAAGYAYPRAGAASEYAEASGSGAAAVQDAYAPQQLLYADEAFDEYTAPASTSAGAKMAAATPGKAYTHAQRPSNGHSSAAAGAGAAQASTSGAARPDVRTRTSIPALPTLPPQRQAAPKPPATAAPQAQAPQQAQQAQQAGYMPQHRAGAQGAGSSAAPFQR